MDDRLNGLVALLQAVGVDSSEMAAVSSNLKGGNAAAQLNDQQIEVIIRKLQQAQAEAPQIIAALEAHAESRSQGSGNLQEQKQAEQSHTEEDEDEDSDEEDDDANYPMVGPGISDDISVVSDLTTPTVCNAPVPDEEHYHETAPPMIVGGGAAPPMMINPSKRKNLVNQVRPAGHIASPSTRRNVPAVSRSNGSGSASAKRRPAHGKLDGPPSSSTSRRPEGGVVKKTPSSRPSSSKVISSDRSSSSGERKKKKKPISRPPPEQQQHNFDAGGANRWENRTTNHRSSRDHDWNAFDSHPQQQSSSPRKSKNSPTQPTVIDNDGFLVGESFDPFTDASNNPFQQQHSSSAGDLAFGAFSNGSNHHQHHQYHGESPRRNPLPHEPPRGGGLRPADHDTRRSARPKPMSQQQQGMMQQQQQYRADPRSMQSNFSSKPTLRSKAPDAASGGRRRARRASLAM